MPRLISQEIGSPSQSRDNGQPDVLQPGFAELEIAELESAMEAVQRQYGLPDGEAPHTPGGSRIENDREYSNSSQHGSSGSAETNPERPTNIGSLKHPHDCRPCAFVFRISGGELRNRCSNGDACVFCHDPSHPRVRGRRRGAKAKEQKDTVARVDPGQDAWKGMSAGTETPPYGWNFAVPRLTPMPPAGEDIQFISALSAATESMNHLSLWNKMSLDAAAAAQDPARQPAVVWP